MKRAHVLREQRQNHGEKWTSSRSFSEVAPTDRSRECSRREGEQGEKGKEEYGMISRFLLSADR